MQEKLKIVIVLGTTRQKRQSVKAAKLVEDIGKEFSELDLIFVDVKDFFPLPGEGNDEESKHPRWVEINKKADGYVIVAPEYNHSFPGSLKMLLDNDLGNYTHKPVIIAGVSSGVLGGARMIESLLHPLRELGFTITFSDIRFPKVKEFFDESQPDYQQKLDDQKERIRSAYKELIWMAKSLKWGRENL